MEELIVAGMWIRYAHKIHVQITAGQLWGRRTDPSQRRCGRDLCVVCREQTSQENNVQSREYTYSRAKNSHRSSSFLVNVRVPGSDPALTDVEQQHSSLVWTVAFDKEKKRRNCSTSDATWSVTWRISSLFAVYMYYNNIWYQNLKSINSIWTTVQYTN